MTKVFGYIHLFVIILLGSFIGSCGNDITEQKSQMESRYVRVSGYPEAFSEVEVSTRAVKNDFEVKLSTLYMLIFDANGAIVDVPQFSATGVPTFIIDTHNPSFVSHDQQALKNSDIYLVGNLDNGALTTVRTLTELLEFEIEAKTIHPDADPSFKGLVMIGKTQDKVDLSLERPSTSNNIQEISMVSLYAKVVVNLQIQPEQHLPGSEQEFRMISWKIVNAPRYATLGAPAANVETAPSHNDKLNSILSGLYSGSNPVRVSQSLSYTFYMLEHKRNKVNTVTYPNGMDDNISKQRFKPKLVNEDTDATYMIINGVYLDHQGISHETTYKLYLGANAVDDFYILRDNQYNNNITIKGVSSNNSFDESVVAFDARVTVNSGPIVISIKRETLLDCHYEVRPLDIYVAPGYKVDVTVEQGARSWIGLDMETKDSNNKVVKRDYFTDNLIGSLPKEYGTFTSDFRVWAYFDENITTFDRTGRIIFNCIEEATGIITVLTYTFLQKGLFEVTSNGHTYYIEFHEEYLHNYDPYDSYNNKTDGMFWGLGGFQLSYQNIAFKDNTILGNNVTEGIKKLLTSYTYDFYTSRDISTVGTNGVIINTRSGHDFTKKIVNVAGIGQLKLSETPKSAVEYCYNKNKRNSSGIVSEIKWYLPAIDEIEEIVVEAYGTFSDFQNKYYWASQPAYDYYTYHYTGWLGVNGDGNFFNDNLYYARATKVDYQNSNYIPVASGMSGYVKKYNFARGSGFSIVWGNPREEINPITPVSDPGRQPRTNINRIRCVYMKD